ncbi:MAG: PKD domain-containing protein, partial [Dehalococcoidia bacterium]
NVTNNSLGYARLSTVLPSGVDNAQGTIVLNSQNVALTNAEGTNEGQDPGFKYYDVTGALQDGTNELAVTSDGYMNLAAAILELTYEAPPAGVSFSANLTSGENTLTVQFTDLSYGATGWQWDFNNDGIIDSTEKNPVHTYTNAGTYTVNLTATNAYGSTSMVKTGYITVTGGSGGSTGPIVSFSADITSGTFPLTVQFTDGSTGNVTAWAWDFTNDGVVDSTVQNPAYNYTNAGTYSVNLTATNAEGTNSTVKSGYITVSIVSAASLPLTTEQTGTVSGDLYVGSFQPVPFGNQPTSGVTSRDFDQLFTLPNFTNIQWAKVYVNVYSMSGSRDIPSRTTTSLDGNGDGTYETVLGVEEMTSGSSYSTDGKVYWINDHTNRVYSDYETSYDITNLITSSHPAVHVKNEKTGTEYDGRLKAVTLVVAYNDGDSDTVKYWVNHGHDWFNAGSSSTTFGTAGIPTGFTDATLNNVALSSADSTYTFNGVSQAGANPVAPINYYENHTWSVTGAVKPAADSVFQYALGTGSSFKTTLAALAVKYPGATTVAPVASFTANVTSGTAPLTVNFMDTSSNSPTSWAWDFTNDGVIDATTQNATYTYASAGTYTVNLTVANTAGSNTSVQVGFVTVSSAGPEAPVAAFSVDTTHGGAPLTVHFTDQSTNTPTSWSWSFGDGNTSTDRNPIHTYSTSGTYTVTLTATNAVGNDDEVKTGYILVGRTITVAADGSGDYTSIVSAVGAAVEGDTIFIKKGTYTESTAIALNKNIITLIGENVDKVTVVVPFTNSGILISGSGCHVENLKFTYPTNIITITGNSNVIRNNILVNPYCISMSSSNNLIENNIILTPSYYGIYLPAGAQFNQIRNNYISHSSAANKYSFRIVSDSNIIENNTFRDNEKYGLYINVNNNTVRNNFFINNVDAAIYFYKTTTGNIIYQNTFIGNGVLIYKGNSAAQAPSWVSPATVDYTFNSTPQSAIVGNYWGSSYAGADADGNGIGDTAFTPLSTFGGSDTAPLMGILKDGVIHGGPDTIAPGAGFMVSANSGQAPLAVTFTSWTPGPGTVISYAWDFGDGTTSTDANPSHTYNSGGTYTVSLTVTGPGGSTSVVKPDLVTVTGANADLNVTAISTIYPGYNTVTATIKNLGTSNAGAFKANFTLDGNTTSFDVASLDGGNTTSISVTDTVFRKYNQKVPVTVTVDSENSVAESDETNNIYNATVTVSAGTNYYYGGRYYTGNDIETSVYREGHIGVVYSTADIQYGGASTVTYTTTHLPVPATAKILSARLYQSWTWWGYGAGDTVQFNGHESQAPAALFFEGIDGKNGQAVFNVTDYFVPGSDNTAVITATSSQNYAPLLVVVYEDASEPLRKIWVDEGSDTLYSDDLIITDPYVAYAMFHNVTTTGLSSAKMTAFLPSGGDRNVNAVLFNGQLAPVKSIGGTDPTFKYAEVTSAIKDGTNEMGVRMFEAHDYLNLAVAILEITQEARPEVSFTANMTSGTAPVAVQFTDLSYGATSWQWDFNNDGTIDSTEKNPVHTYTNAGTYTVNLTATNAYGSTSMVKTGYITVTGGSGGNTGPVVSFSADITSGTFPLTVRFTDG